MYLVLLAAGGTIVPLSKMPDGVANVVQLLPSAALGQGLRDVLHDGAGLAGVLGPVAVLVAWGVGAAWLAVRYFRWE